MATPQRKTSERELDQWNRAWRQSDVYLNFMRRSGLPTDGRVKLSRKQQSQLEKDMAAAGTPIPKGMHLDQGGNLNQKNRLGKTSAIVAGTALGAYLGGPALFSAFGGGGGAAGGAAGTLASSPILGAGAAGVGLPTAVSMGGLAGAGTAGGAAAGIAGAAAKGGGLFSRMAGLAGNPLVRGAGSALLGGFMSNRAENEAMRLSPAEQAAQEGAMGAGGELRGLSGELRQTGQGLIQEGMPGLQQSGSYWSRLLGGDRAQMAQATAAPRAAITDIYRGAERGLERSMVRGATREVQLGELNRQRASQLAGLTTGVQPMAAQQLAGISGSMMGQGGELLGQAGTPLAQAGSIYGDILGKGFERRKYGREQGAEAGSKWGKFAFNMLGNLGKGA